MNFFINKRFLILFAFILSLASSGFARNDSKINSEPEYLNWIKEAKKGDAGKEYLSGLAFYRGIGGAARDYKKAFEWFKRASKNGNSAASVNLGDMYILGHFVSKDENKAFQYYLQAAKLGNSEGMEKLGDVYVNGDGLVKNNFEAAKWYKKSAEKSFVPGPSLKLARLYYLGGEHFKKNEKKALKWFINAFEMGDADAAHYISGIYEDNGDYRQAGKWLLKGANKGGSLAMFYLAKAYAGAGEYSDRKIVDFSYAQSYKWLSVLTKKEYQIRFDKLFRQVASKLSADEKAQAEKLAAPLISKLVSAEEIKWTKKVRAKPLKLK